MALHLIIDGYNLIRQSSVFRALDASDLEAEREALLEFLAAYRRDRPGHQVTVVFDGWQAGGLKETRDVHQGIRVIFSRRGQKADEVVKRLLSQDRGRALAVSSDLEIRNHARQVGAAWVDARHFEMLAGHRQRTEAEKEEFTPPRSGTAKKGPARRLGKKERQRQKRLQKL